MELGGSVPHSQVPASCPYPELARSSPYPTSHLLKIHLNIIFPSTPGSPKLCLSHRLPHQNPVYASPLPHTHYMPLPCHSSLFYHPKNIGWGVHPGRSLAVKNQTHISRSCPGPRLVPTPSELPPLPNNNITAYLIMTNLSQLYPSESCFSEGVWKSHLGSGKCRLHPKLLHAITSKTMRFHPFISHIQAVHKMYTHSTHFFHSHL